MCAQALERCGVTERSNSVPGDLLNARLPWAGAVAGVVDSEQAFCTLSTAVNGDAGFTSLLTWRHDRVGPPFFC